MKIRLIVSAILSLLTMVVTPLVAIYYHDSNDALGILFLLLLVLNPIVSIIIGVLNGVKNVNWYPVINAVIFLISYSIITAFDITLIITALIYVALSFTAAFITKAITNKSK